MNENKKESNDWSDWAKAYEVGIDEEKTAGEEGTDELKDKYSKETPGQTSDADEESSQK